MIFRRLVMMALLSALSTQSFAAGDMTYEFQTPDIEVEIRTTWTWDPPALSGEKAAITMKLPLVTHAERPATAEGRELKAAMTEGATDSDTQHRIGRLLLDGWGGVQASPTEAYQWLGRAAARGHAAAQSDLGALLIVGKGTPQSYDRAFDWFSRAAAQGNAEGQFGLGLCHLFGLGTVMSPFRARQNFEKSAGQHYFSAELVLSAQRLVAGIVPYDERKAYELLSLSLVHGGSRAEDKNLDTLRSALLQRLSAGEVRSSQSSTRAEFQKDRNEAVTVLGPSK